MKVTVTGGTGFLGRALTSYLVALGHECTVVSRDPERAARIQWPRGVTVISDEEIGQVDAIIHLAGASVVGWWTPWRRRAIFESRVQSTKRLVEKMRTGAIRPKTFLVASAIGYYGDRPDEELTEESGPDPKMKFRARVCLAWEAAAAEAEALGVRTVQLRLANVMAMGGGYLGGLLPIVRKLGSWTIGNPESHLSWIAMEDAVRLIAFALENETIRGPLNVVAPFPITQRTLASTLAFRSGQKVQGTIPSWLLRTVLGEFSRALLDDQTVLPKKATEAGFKFLLPAWRACIDAVFEDAEPVGEDVHKDRLTLTLRGSQRSN